MIKKSSIIKLIEGFLIISLVNFKSNNFRFNFPSDFFSLFDALGLFIPLIVVNCLVLGRAEAFASKQSIWSSIVDGLGMGLGFSFALTLLGGVREILGSGAIFGFQLISGDMMLVFVLAPGAFIALGYLIALMNRIVKN